MAEPTRPVRLAAAFLTAAAFAAALPASPVATAADRVKSGTGFFVSRDGFLVTSAHVVAGCPHVSVWRADGRERPSYVVAADARHDVALLWVDGGAAQPAVAADALPRPGEDVFTLGFGVSATRPLHSVVSAGTLLGDSRAQPGNRILVIRARLHAGNSGGAVLVGDGTLVGMVIGRDEADPGLGVAIPLDDIEALLAAYGIALPQHAAARGARDYLAAISVLIQCTPPS